MPFAIAALIVGFAFYPAQSPKPHRAPESSSTHVGDKANPTDSSTEKTSPPPNAAPVGSPTQTEDNPHSASEGDEGVHIQRQLEIATWVLVAIGIATAGFICWQGWETRKAAEAAKNGIELQRVAMRQWVELVDWQAPPVERVILPEELTIPMSFAILNPTALPLKLVFATIDVDNSLNCASIIGGFLLAPRSKQRMPFNVKLTGAKLERYRKGHDLMGITVHVKFENAFEKLQEQDFGVLTVCGEGRENTFEPFATGQKKQERQPQQEAN